MHATHNFHFSVSRLPHHLIPSCAFCCLEFVVAVAGLPNPRKDHAATMAKFARRCIAEHILTAKRLELTLGPDTGDLRLRVGLHSGPITAGVLRGERSRFQLFGDTVNTAARLETSGEGNKIHISEATAKLLIGAGMEDWLVERKETVQLKGKGTLKTYWVTQGSSPRSDGEEHSSDTAETGVENALQQLMEGDPLDTKKLRLVDWNVDLLIRLMKQIVARRASLNKGQKSPKSTTAPPPPQWNNAKGTHPLDEIVEIIHLPELPESARQEEEDITNIVLDPDVISLTRDYVMALAAMYHDNPFHNFEHASHVTMSVAKLLSRIVAPSDMDFTDGAEALASLHDHTYGITSDPLTQFACVFSALIHDVDHQGVTNTQLVLEKDPLAVLYRNKSVAEQNSVELAWKLLLTDRYDKLRSCLCADATELARLRQLVVNGVMATDIMDKDLKVLRNQRWDKAFQPQDHELQDPDYRNAINRKATIVIEHLIQASDVSHTMQHWTVYQKWSHRLFREMYKAYKEGRSDKDPSENWYKGEIGFFDFYIIPLAKKLKECGVFGVCSEEYLQYALNNRNEWEQKGEQIVAELIQSVV
jgi:3'5'-cyclic nucleotide phosphodiesterase/Adenylate and Guanylate cyclase catalytic domain